jgi:hypothetical protein
MRPFPHISRIMLGLALAAVACGIDDEPSLAPEQQASIDPSLRSGGEASQYAGQEVASTPAQQLITSSSGECCYSDECDPFPEGLEIIEEDCPDPSPGAPGLWIPSWNFDACVNGLLWDPDDDWVDNGCENALAMAFAPDMVVTTADANWDYSLNQPVGRLGGEYYFAVQQGSDQDCGSLRIAYLPAYYLDDGVRYDQLDLCLAVFGSPASWCAGHTGDSEFILIDVYYDFATHHWVSDKVFLSAHCETPSGNECTWYTNLSIFEWRDGMTRGAPVVWVSEKKHANYPSQNACNSGVTVGFVELEHCEFNTIDQVFPVVYTQQNIGSRTTPLRDCAPAFWGSAETSAGWEECLWQAPQYFERFNGWQRPPDHDGSTPYVHWLVDYAKF